MHDVTPAPTTRVETAPAKINLTLRVVGRRPDGYHLLDSLVAFADIGDTMTVTPADQQHGIRLTVDGPLSAGVPTDQSNLVVGAAERYLTATGIETGLDIRLTKRLPAAAGIGGGSSDAAAMMRALTALFPAKRLSDSATIRLAGLVGADVPVCLTPRSWRMQGIGEGLTPGPCVTGTPIVMVNPRVPVATRSVFKARSAAFSPTLDLPQGPLSPEAVAHLIAVGGNDLQSPAIRVAPVIDQVLATLGETPRVLAAKMSGSGATCIGISRSYEDAADIAESLGTTYPSWWVTAAKLL